MSQADLNEEAIWWQRDAAYVYAQAALYRADNTSVADWVAVKVQASAAHSAAQGRKAADKARAS